MGDIAVDDIVVSSGGCAVYPSEAARGVNYLPPDIHSLMEMASSVSAPGLYDCTFQQDLCSWSSTAEDVCNNMVKLTLLIYSLKGIVLYCHFHSWF